MTHPERELRLFAREWSDMAARVPKKDRRALVWTMRASWATALADTINDVELYAEKMRRDRNEAVRAAGADLLGILDADA